MMYAFADLAEGKMIASGGYFDGSQDPIIMAGSMIHDSSQSSIYQSTNAEEQNFRVTTFSIEDLSNPADADHTSEPARTIDHLQHHLRIDMDQDHSGHMILEAPPVETANLVSAICGVQDHILSHQIGEGPHNMTVEQQILNYDVASYPNGAYTAAHDLLNVLQIQRCNLTPEFPSTEHIFGDPVQNTVSHLDMNSDLSGVAIHESGMMFSDSTLPLGYNATQSHLLKDLYHSLPQNYGLFTSDDERDGMTVPGVSGNIFQEIDGRQFDSPILGKRRQKGGFGKAKGKANFATERERREQLNVKYGALRSLFPNPTKSDRASIVGDAIEYINELNRTVKDLKILVEKNRNSTDRRKMLKLDDEAADDGDSSSMQPVRDDQNNQMDGAIRSSWVQRRSKDCEVDVRMVDDEINIKFTEKKRANSLLCAAKIFEELHLELIHVVGGIIGDHHIFMFNAKIPKGSSLYACAVAKKLIEAVEMKHQALNIR
ncbi:hypothetical protein PR202_ga02402 [Eleusine coracana subsp. coracana]|uniref:BHLH domain-containing protein n=1 Tax=Eleusine coracana subsp. coracana TaxID=191504 RepID=A0AAV5BJC5_ELECO|nr:hypothetical protein PR202_ga02402 [Eleusine coracana subsp. coracana]